PVHPLPIFLYALSSQPSALSPLPNNPVHPLPIQICVICEICVRPFICVICEICERQKNWSG
ncbi:MAG TPA: hypothetical protein PLZ48_03660, partial [Candidatus Cloacimonas sp.]|nr:hypothetical protein [Candidatus Cloacimonas sp.]